MYSIRFYFGTKELQKFLTLDNAIFCTCMHVGRTPHMHLMETAAMRLDSSACGLYDHRKKTFGVNTPQL